MQIKFEVQHSGFQTPPASVDGRRNSLASHSSYCNSFASSASSYNDYSMPVTPTCDRSPLPDDSFDVAVGQFGMHQMPMVSSQKQFSRNEGLYEPFVMVPPATRDSINDSSYDGFVMVPPSTTVTSTSLYMNTLMPTSGMVGPGLHQDAMDASISFPGSAWENQSAITWPDNNHSRSHQSNHLAGGLDQFQMQWEHSVSTFDHSGDLFSPTTITPSEMMDDEFVHIPQDAFSTNTGAPYTFDASARASYDQVPQEASYQRAGLPTLKEETSDVDEESDRTQQRIFYRPTTGAKGVAPKKERRSAGSSRRKQQKAQIEVCLKSKFPCSLCPKRFKRQEHQKRHVVSHNKKLIVASCEYRSVEGTECPKVFNRNDNCIAHYDTHIALPGKKVGRNQKESLQYVLSCISDPKMVERVRQQHHRKLVAKHGRD